MLQQKMKKKNIRLAVIDNSIDHSVYNPVRHWKISLKTKFSVYRAVRNHFPDPGNFTHLILTGSEASILEKEKWVSMEIDLVKRAFDMGLSVLGSCYGHQLLAVALAGPRYVQKCVHPEIGWILLRIGRNNGFLGNAGKAYAFSSHFDEVIDLPKNFQVMASSDRCSIQAFGVKNRPIWGLQIHPEINIAEARRYLRNRVEKGHAPLRLFKQALDSGPRDSGLIRHVVEKFCLPTGK
jgi:GMP synthase-like glutamine amidotransferase